MAEFCNSFLAGNSARATEVDGWLQPVHEILFVESSPTPTKWALSDLGHIEAGIRLPLLPLSTQHHGTVRERIAAAGAHA